MAKFSYVNKEKQLVEFSFNNIKPENPINDFIQNNSVDDSYDFDELTTNGIYLFQNISKINNEVKHRPAALAGSGQLFFFSEEPSKANRIVFQLVFSDSDESKLHYRRGMANSAGLQFEEWQSTSRSTEAASNFAISKVSPASVVGGSWIKNSSVPASMIWEHSGVSTYVDGQTSGMNVLLNLETFALSASQEVYIKESGAFQKMTLGIGCGGTGSTTAEGARNALGAASQTDLNSLRDSVSKILPTYSGWEGLDLNDIKHTAIISCYGDVTLNMPVKGWGVCLCLSMDQYMSQLYINNYSNDHAGNGSVGDRIYIRSWEPTSLFWTSWEAISANKMA